jgi:hypothetical protein
MVATTTDLVNTIPTEADVADLDLSDITPIDNHCHTLLAEQGPWDLPRWRMFFSESVDPALWQDHVQHTPSYIWSMNALATEFGCEPTEDAVLAYRNAHHGDDLSARLLRAARFDTLMLDDGWPNPTDAVPRDRMAALADCNVGWIHRLEVRQQRLVVECDSFDQFVERYRDDVSTARERGIRAVKSIAAYRGGLEIGSPDPAAARAAFGRLKETARRDGAVRIADKAFLDFTLHLALKQLAKQRLPLQFHTGYGDTDADLRTSNPLLLRSILEDPRYRDVPIVLLHQSWPYVREAAFLTQIYANAYMDLSFSIPHLSYGEMVRFSRAALDAAPSSKLLVATDTWGIPEHYFLGAHRMRSILGRVLGEMVGDGVLRVEQAERLGEQIMRGTARRLYALP